MTQEEFQTNWCATDRFARLFDQPLKEKKLWLCEGIISFIENDYRSAYGVDYSHFNVPGWTERFEKLQQLRWEYRLAGQWLPSDNQPTLEAELKGLLECGEITPNEYVQRVNAIRDGVKSGKLSKDETEVKCGGHLAYI